MTPDDHWRRLRHIAKQPRFWIAEWALRGLVSGRCSAYGGIVSGPSVRLCTKPRWHTDSHTYDAVPISPVERQKTGLERVRDAVREARGGDAPEVPQVFA